MASRKMEVDSLVAVCSQFEHAVVGIRRPAEIEQFEDNSRGVYVVCAQPYDMSKAKMITLDTPVWSAITSNPALRVKTVYFIVDPAAGTSSLVMDVLPETTTSMDPVPFLAPTLFPASVAVIPPDSVPRTLTANAMHHSLVLAIVDGLSNSLLGWMCINPENRRTNMPSDVIDIQVFPYTGSGYPEKTVLVVAQVAISAEDGRFAVSSRTIDAICRLGAPTNAVSVATVVLSPAAGKTQTYVVTYHVIVSVVQTDQVFSRDVTGALSATHTGTGSRKRARGQRAAAGSGSVASAAGLMGWGAAYHSASDDDDDNDRVRKQPRSLSYK